MAEFCFDFRPLKKCFFYRILRDVEANTVRLKEHGKDVLVLEKIPVKSSAFEMAAFGHQTVQLPTIQHRYSVMAGTPEKMLEYLLETRIDAAKDDSLPDTLLEDFLLTHLIFMPANVICNALIHYYKHAMVSFTSKNYPMVFQILHTTTFCHWT